MRGRGLKLIFAGMILVFSCGSITGQDRDFHYNFLNLQENRFHNLENTLHHRKFKAMLKDAGKAGSGNIHMVHIGDSHMQAGFFPNRIRMNLQRQLATDTLPNLGFIFPYAVAKTNNPANYAVSWSGNWSTCKAMERDAPCPLGLSGITLTTRDSVASITIRLRDHFPSVRYKIQKARLFCHYPESGYQLELNGIQTRQQENEGWLEASFPGPTDTLRIKIRKKETGSSGMFSISGITLTRDRHGLNYHAIGVNGAKASSYLRCKHLPSQLASLNPNGVIVSLGTNEAYNTHFDPRLFHEHLSRLVETIREQTPETWILLTTPGDALREGKLYNPNNHKARRTVIQVAREQNCAYWDFFKVMGGEHSILSWYYSGLTARDKLHLNKRGYQLKADLFFEAFLSSLKPSSATKTSN